MGKSAHSELALFALYWLVVTFPYGIVHILAMISMRVKSYLRTRIATLVPSMRRLTHLSLVSSLFSLLSSLFSAPSPLLFSFIFSFFCSSTAQSSSASNCPEMLKAPSQSMSLTGRAEKPAAEAQTDAASSSQARQSDVMPNVSAWRLAATEPNQNLDLSARAGKPAAKGSDIVDVDSRVAKQLISGYLLPVSHILRKSTQTLRQRIGRSVYTQDRVQQRLVEQSIFQQRLPSRSLTLLFRVVTELFILHRHLPFCR